MLIFVRICKKKKKPVEKKKLLEVCMEDKCIILVLQESTFAPI